MQRKAVKKTCETCKINFVGGASTMILDKRGMVFFCSSECLNHDLRLTNDAKDDLYAV